MVQDRNHVSLWISPGKHGRQIREKYFRAGKPCPVLISCGHDPLLFLAGGNELKFGLSEYDYAGGHRGEPYEVVLSELHGLPMPAHAEIVLEGELVENVKAKEGPFGEFTGYYASSPSEQPVVQVKRVYYRNDPILGIASPMRPPSDFSFSKCVMKAGMIWDEVERAGLAGVAGVWVHEFGGARMFNVIAIKQAYPGHARQAGLLAAGCQSASYLGRFVVVVDEDVDPTDLFDVMWAMCTRCDPANDIEFVRRAWSGPLDPLLDKASSTNSRAIIDACRPYERLEGFPDGGAREPRADAQGQGKVRRPARQDRLRVTSEGRIANGEAASSGLLFVLISLLTIRYSLISPTGGPTHARSTRRAAPRAGASPTASSPTRASSTPSGISARATRDPNRYFISRHRASELVEPSDVLEMTLDSKPVVPTGVRLYSEMVIHGEIYKARPDVNSVCHHHAMAILPFCATGVELVPLFHLGGTLGAKVPFWDSRDEFGDTNLLVRTPEEGASHARALGPHFMVLLRRHGATLAGRSLRECVFRSIYTTRNAELQLRAMAIGTPGR